MDEILIGNRLGPDEALFEIAVDHPRRLGRKRPFADRPGAGLFRANGEKCLQLQQFVPSPHQPVEPGLFKTQTFKKLSAFGIVKLADFLFDGGRDHHHARPFARRHFSHPGRLRIAIGGVVFVDIADIKHRLGGQKLQHVPGAAFLVRYLDRPCRFAILQGRKGPAQQHVLFLGLLVAAFQLARQVLKPPFNRFHVGDHQFCLDGLGIGHRVNATLDMRYVAVLKAAKHMRNGVAFADIGEKLVAEPLAFRRALHQTGNVDKGHPRRDDLFRAGDCRQLVKPRVRHRNLADIGLDRAERKIRRLCRGRPCKRVEQRRFADIRQPNDPGLEAHSCPPAADVGAF